MDLRNNCNTSVNYFSCTSIHTYTLLVLFLLCFSVKLKAQSRISLPIPNDVEVYEAKQNAIFLLKNTDNLLPLRDLHKIKIIHYPSRPTSPRFKEMLNQYTSVTSIFWPPRNSFSIPIDSSSPFQSSANLDEITAQFGEENMVFIVPLFGNLLSKLPEILESIPQKSKIILTLFGSPKTEISLKNHPRIHSIILTPVPFWGSYLTAQLIFGAIPAKNKLTTAINEDFPVGTGETFRQIQRLGYAPAETVGINAAFLERKIDSVMQKGVDMEAFPGGQVLVAKQGKVVFHKTYGYHTYEPLPPNATPQQTQHDDIYDFASVSKITTGLPALMRLHGQGKFNLETTLGDYVPKMKRSNKTDLTFREMLAHNARLKAWIPYWKSTIKEDGTFKWRTLKKEQSKRFPTYLAPNLYLHKKYQKQIYKKIKGSPLNEKEGYKYSGLLFYLMPEMIEDLTGENFETYLDKQFYHRLGAYSLGYNPTDEFPLERIVPTERDTFFRQTQIHGYVHDEGAAMMKGISCNAGLFGNANDLAKLLQMYLNGGTYGGERYIEKSSIKTFTECQYCEEGNRRGLGFDKPLIEYHPQNSSTAKDASPESYGHSGYTGTFVWVDPKYELIYIFLSNRVHPTRDNRKIYQYNIRPTIHQAIYDSFLKY